MAWNLNQPLFRAGGVRRANAAPPVASNGYPHNGSRRLAPGIRLSPA